MNDQQSWPNPRAWMRRYFSKNSDGFARDASGGDAPDWTRSSVLAGDIVLSAVKDAIVCWAAGRSDLAEGCLARSRRLIAEAQEATRDKVEIDKIGLDRVQITIAERLAIALNGNQSESSPMPFEAFSRHLAERRHPRSYALGVWFLWAVVAVLEGDEGEYEQAKSLRRRVYPGFEKEMGLRPYLGELSAARDHPRWREFEEVLARWLNPILRSERYEATCQPELAAVLVLMWVKNHLRRLERDTVLKTYFGETLSIPVPVG